MTIAEHLSRLPPRAQRSLALLLVPTALVLFCASVVWPIRHAYRRQVQWRATAAHLLAQRRGLVGIEAAVQAQLDALPRLQSWEKLYRATAGDSGVIALQTEVSAVLTGAHARAQALTPMQVAAAGPFRKIGVQIAVTMTIDQLKEVLLRLSELQHWVQVQQLLVDAPSAQAPTENPSLIVTLEIVGYAIDGVRDQ